MSETPEPAPAPKKEKGISIQPIGKYVLVRVLQIPLKTAAGVVLPAGAETAMESSEGIVIEAGPEAQANGIEKGHRVIFNRFAGTTIQIPGAGTLRHLRWKEILSIVHGEDLPPHSISAPIEQ